MSRLAITGALGHIGSKLIRAFQPDDYEEIVLIDDLSAQRYCSLFDLPSGVAFRFVEADVCTADLSRLFDGVDTVIHLAAITNAASSFEIQHAVERVNVDGTERVARACLATESRLFFASTTSVYGSQRRVVDELCPDEELIPQSPYAMSKLKAEKLLADLGEQGLSVIACRFGTIFGPSPGMRFHTAVNRFCWQAVTGEPLSVWRTAMDQQRPYLDVADAVAAIKLILSNDSLNGLFNVVTLNATVREIVAIISRHVPSLQVKLVDSPVMNQLSYEVSSRKFEGLGFAFTGDLEEGIGLTLALLEGITPHASALAQPAQA